MDTVQFIGVAYSQCYLSVTVLRSDTGGRERGKVDKGGIIGAGKRIARSGAFLFPPSKKGLRRVGSGITLRL